MGALTFGTAYLGSDAGPRVPPRGRSDRRGRVQRALLVTCDALMTCATAGAAGRP